MKWGLGLTAYLNSVTKNMDKKIDKEQWDTQIRYCTYDTPSILAMVEIY